MYSQCHNSWSHLSLLFSERILQIVIMKKEMLSVHVKSAQVKEKRLRDFQEPILQLVRRSCALLGLGD